MKEEIMKKWTKIAMMLCAVAGVASLAMFLPQVREMIIDMGERYVGRPLTHEVWHGRFVRWEIQFLFLLLVFLLSGTSNWDSVVLSEPRAKILSWTFVGVVSVFLLIAAGISGDIWVDETFSLGLARHSVKKLVSLTARDTLPPLYYCLLHLAMILFPNSVFAAKVVSVIPTILLMCAATVFFAKEYSHRDALLFNMLLVSTYSVLQYSVEIRMYSWALLFCGLCAIASWYMVRTGSLRSFLTYVLFAECGAYCHHWTAFGLALHFALVSLLRLAKGRKSLKTVLLSSAVGVALYLPWAFVVVGQISRVAGDFWIPPVTVKDFAQYILTVIPLPSVMKVMAAVFICLLFALCMRGLRRKEPNVGYLLAHLFTPFLVILCATIISFAVRPLFVKRYAVPLTAFVSFFIVLACRERWVSRRLVFAFSCLALLGSVMSMGQLAYDETFVARTDREFAAMMRENLTESTVFVFTDTINSHIPRCLAYRYPQNRIFGYEIPELWADAYFYDRQNLIDTLDGEHNLCLILPQDEEPPETFADIVPKVARMSIYPAYKFYFMRR